MRRFLLVGSLSVTALSMASPARAGTYAVPEAGEYWIASAALASLDGVTVPSGTSRASVDVGGQTCPLTLVADKVAIEPARCPTLYQLGDGETAVFAFAREGKEPVKANLRLLAAISGGGPIIAAPGDSPALPKDLGARAAAFRVGAGRWYPAKKGTTHLEPSTDSGARTLAAWSRAELPGALTLRFERKSSADAELAFAVLQAVQGPSAVPAAEVAWEAGEASRPLSLLLSFVVTALPTNTRTVIVRAGDESCRATLEPADGARPRRTMPLNAQAAGCGGLFSKVAGGVTALSVEVTDDAQPVKTMTLPVATPSTLPAGTTSVSLLAGAEPTFPSWWSPIAQVAFQLPEQNGWTRGEIVDGHLRSFETSAAPALAAWKAGSVTGDLRGRARAADAPMVEYEWTFAHAAAPVRRTLAGVDGTLGLTVDTAGGRWEVAATELAAATEIASTTTVHAFLQRQGRETLICTLTAGTPVSRGECPEIFALADGEEISFRPAPGVAHTLKLARPLQSVAYSRGPGSADLMAGTGLERLACVGDTQCEASLAVAAIRFGDAPWVTLKAETSPVKAPDDVDDVYAVFRVPGDDDSEGPDADGGEDAPADAAQAALRAWVSDADPTRPLYVRMKTLSGAAEVERVLTWNGPPEWCNASPTVPKEWVRGSALPYVVCFDLRGTKVRPILPTGVPILYPNQPIAVVVRSDGSTPARVTVTGEAGLEREGTRPGEVTDDGVAPTAMTGGGATALETAIWHFGPRTSGAPVVIGLATGETSAPVATMDLAVRPVYSSAIRVGVSGLIVPANKSYEVVGVAGSSETFVGEQSAPFVPELVVGYATSFSRTPREDMFPRLTKPTVGQRFGAYVGLGVLSPESTEADAFPLDFFTTLYLGAEVELTPGTAIVFAHAVRRTASLWEGWDKGDPGADIAKATATTYQPGFAVILNVSPSFFRFARSFPAALKEKK